MSQLGIVGDIHGHLDSLRRLIDAAAVSATEFVFLGDYINRGPDSSGVIDYLLELAASTPRMVFLAGNHDRAFEAALNGEFERFLVAGGAATVRSYVDPPYDDVEAEFIAAVPASHRRFLEDLVEEYTTDDLHIAHRLPAKSDGRFRVGGHSPQRASVPTIGETFAQIDTGSGTFADGRLTCLFWPSLGWISEPAG